MFPARPPRTTYGSEATYDLRCRYTDMIRESGLGTSSASAVFSSPARAGVALRAAELPAPTVDFSRDIQPILSDNCYFCHGPDSGKRKGDLRLDRLDPKIGPFSPRDGYTIIKPGKLDESTLADRITSDDPDVKMPPPASHRVLTPAQVQLLQRWIEQGAKWGKLWSLIPPQRPGALPGRERCELAAQSDRCIYSSAA